MIDGLLTKYQSIHFNEPPILNYRHIDPTHLPTAFLPVSARNISMQQWETAGQRGYASLYW